MCFKGFNNSQNVFALFWTIFLLAIGNSFGLPWGERIEGLDYANDLDRFIPDDYHYYYKEQNSFIDFVIDKGCSFLAG